MAAGSLFAKFIGGILSMPTRAAVAAVSADDEGVYNADATGGAFAVTLPAASGVRDGTTKLVRKTDTSANAVTVAPASGTVNGAASVVLTRQGDSVLLVSELATNTWRSYGGGGSAGLVAFWDSATLLSYALGLAWDAALRQLTITSQNRGAGIVRETAVTAAVRSALSLRHKTSGTIADGFGVVLPFEVEDGGGAVEVGAVTSARMAGAANDGDGEVGLNPGVNGDTTATVWRARGDGRVDIDGKAVAPPVSPASDGSFYFDTVLQKWRVSENAGPWGNLLDGGDYVGEVSTANATATVVPGMTVPIPTDKAVVIESTLVGIRDDGAATRRRKFIATFQNDGGTVTLVDSVIDGIHGLAGAATFDISGTSVEHHVIGVAAENYTWRGRARVLVT